MSQTRFERSFTLTRVLPAPRNAVFAAWTEPEHLAWFYNPAMPAPTTPIQVDLRVGGVWRQQMVVDDDVRYITGGVYLEIVPSERLVFRWGATGGWPDLARSHQEEAPIVALDLRDVAEGTHLELNVTFPDKLVDEEVYDLIHGAARDGWSATVDRVAHSTAITTSRLRESTGTCDERALLIPRDAHLLAQLVNQRRHVLRAVSGLAEHDMHRALVPSGWTITRLLNHLAYDDEMFWISAVLGGDTGAIEALHDGWSSVPMTGAEAIDVYERQIARSDEVLRRIDLDAPPLWTPPASVFDAPPMRNGREVIFRVLAETSVHAGHLDIVRELIDGHQDLVVG